MRRETRIFGVAGALAVSCGGAGTPSPASDARATVDAADAGDAVDDGAATACPPGTWSHAGAPCVPAGVPTCAAGFVSDGDGGCTAVLPATPCADGEVAWIGETACHEIVGCGDGTWGDVPTEADSVYVDGAYDGGDSDGSLEKPWRSVQDGVDHCPAGAIVAVAAGDYAEEVAITERPVRLWGRCPRLVTISGDSVPRQTSVPTALLIGIPGAEVHGLRVAPRNAAVTLQALAPVAVDAVDLRSNAAARLTALSTQDDVELTHALVRGPVEFGAGTASLRDVTIVGDATMTGISVDARAHVWLAETRIVGEIDAVDTSGETVVVRSALDDSVASALVVGAGRVTLVDTTISRTGAAAVVTDRARHPVIGLTSTTIRSATDGAIFARGDATVSADALRIGDVSGYGIFLDSGVSADLHGVHLSNVSPSADGQGYGISAYAVPMLGTSGPPPPTHLRIDGAVVDGATGVGIAVIDADADVRGTVIRGLARLPDGSLGDGFSVVHDQADARLSVVNGEVEGAPRAAIASFGARVDVGGTRFVDDAIDLDVEPSLGKPGAIVDDGGNVCSFGAEARACLALSAGLSPPRPPGGG